MDTLRDDPSFREVIKSLQKEIIERKWAEKRANDALDYAESIVDSVPSPIIVLDDEFKVISTNIPFFQLFNLTITQSIGKQFFQLANGLFNINLLKEIVISNEKDVEHIYLYQDFPIVGKKHLEIKCVNLQYNIKHLKFKLLIINDITEIRNGLEDIKTQHLLLNEIHHRTKNNLMMIESIFKLQLDTITDLHIKEFLTDSIGRISAITNIHKILSQSGNIKSIDFKMFITSLVDNIKALYSTQVQFNFDLIDVKLTFDQGVNLGIVINEIITNSFKYAFKEIKTQPQISISLTRIDSTTKLLCIISDNGDTEKKSLDLDTSLGFKLIENIVESKLKGSWKVNYNFGLFHQIEFENEIVGVEKDLFSQW